MDDTISRQEALDLLNCSWADYVTIEQNEILEDIRVRLMKLPPSSQEPEIKPISYMDCSNAMLKMWMDGVVTDGEYDRIMDKLNAHEMEEREKRK